ncbi:MAG: HAMP domain-containing sensor histidine kinase [Acidimicrobiales bacterium]
MKLRTRVLLGFTLIFVVVVAVAVFTVNAQRSQLYDQVDDRLNATPLPAETRARPAPGTPRVDGEPLADGLGRAEARPVDDQSISDLYVAVITADNTVRPVIRGQLLVDVPDLQTLVDDRPAGGTIVTTSGIDGTSTFRVLYLAGTEVSFETVVALPLDDVDDTVRQLTLIFAGAAGLILVVLSLIASWLNRFGLRPISAMTDVAQAISAGERDRRADPANDATEAGRLGHALNLMLDERDAGEERLRRFVSDASHELRTPLTSIRGYLDLYQAGGFRQPGQLDDALRRLQVEAERMHLLVEDLLVLSTSDEERPLDISAFRLDEMIVDVVALALGGQPDRHIEADVSEAREIEADRLRLHQAIAVLVDNALRHTPDDAAVRVAARSTGRRVEISVTDDGPGLTPEEAATAFDRFSRGDPSRTRRTGGAGLGLSIARAIVQAHGGEILVSTTPGAGATFTIVLPANGQP